MADQEVARLVAIMEANLKGFAKGMDQAKAIADQRFGQIEKRMAQTETAASKFGSTFGETFQRFFAVGAIVGAVTAFTKATVASVGALGDQAAIAGVTVEQLQAYRAAAADAGASSALADTALQRLTRTIGEAQGGNKELISTFSQLGISADQLAGGTTAVLPLIAQALSNISNTAERARIETDLFGKSGQSIETVLQAWSASADSLQDHFSKLGVIIDAATAEKFSKAQGQFELFELGMQAGLVRIIAGLGDLATAERRTKLFGDGVDAGQLAVQKALGFKPTLRPSGIAGGERKIATPGELNLIRPGLDLAPDIHLITQQRATLEDAASAAGVGNIAGFDDETLRLLTEFHREATDAWDKYYEGIVEKDQQSQDLIQASKDAASERETERIAKSRQALSDSITAELDARRDFAAEIQSIEDDADQREAEQRQRRIDEESRYIKDVLIDRISDIGDEMERAGGKFGKAVGNMVLDILKLITKMEIAKAIETALGSIGSGGAGSWITKILGIVGNAIPGSNTGTGGGGFQDVADIPGRASGGSVMAGHPYIVGERHPELFIPKTDGMIMPSLAGAGKSVQVNITQQMSFAGAIDAESMMSYANQAAAAGSQAAVNHIQRAFPTLMIRASRDKL